MLDLPNLSAYAHRVARETTRPRGTVETTREVVETQTESKFFGLSSRTVEFPRLVTESEPIDHWVLETRFWKRTARERVGNIYKRIDRETYQYCLHVDGRLIVRTVEVGRIFPRGGEPWDAPREPKVAPMTEKDILLLDWEPKNYSGSTREFHVETNRDASIVLRSKAKGDRLSLLLRKLLS